MGMVKRALDKNEKRLEERYPIYTPQGVAALLHHLHTVEGETLKGNYDAVILLLDLRLAIEDCFLTPKQRAVIDLLFYQDRKPEEVAEIMGVSHVMVRKHADAAINKISSYLEGTEGYTNYGDLR